MKNNIQSWNQGLYLQSSVNAHTEAYEALVWGKWIIFAFFLIPNQKERNEEKRGHLTPLMFKSLI